MENEEYNYRGFGLQKIDTIEKKMARLLLKNPENKTLQAVGMAIDERSQIALEMLQSWYAPHIQKEYDEVTISNGKCASLGHIDAIELFLGTLERTLS